MIIKYTLYPTAALISSHLTSIVGRRPNLNPEIVPSSSFVLIVNTSFTMLVDLSLLYYESRLLIRVFACARDSWNPTRFFS
jgi:hypothetical protein